MDSKEIILKPEIEQQIQKTSCDVNLEELYDKNPCNEKFNEECNQFLKQKEAKERSCITENESELNDTLYPNLNDPLFNIKIAEKREFGDYQFDGTLHQKVKQYADILAKANFQIAPHQVFIKNFMSSETPYSSLVLYHGLGTGKTCSAIGVAEEYREFMKNDGKKILVIAAESVQHNFKTQLFDERKLVENGGVWSFKNGGGCLGDSLLKEINPSGEKGLSREDVVKQIRELIAKHYEFFTYNQWTNRFAELLPKSLKEDDKKDILKKEFSHRLIIIDEFHNIRKYDDKKNEKLATYLEEMVVTAENPRMLFLSATPMFSSIKEIVWVLNLMNACDKRSLVEPSEIFDEAGNFVPGGEELLIQKATGYISFVKGENPYTFPFRVYPKFFKKENTFASIPYPKKEIGNAKIVDKYDYLKHNVDQFYITSIFDCEQSCNNCQACVYKKILNETPLNMQLALQSLNVSYPIQAGSSISDLVGKKGLQSIMDFTDSEKKGDFEYKNAGKPFFALPNLRRHSAKLANIVESISLQQDKADETKEQKWAEGVILIFSQYIDSGLIPAALALEEMGFQRYGSLPNLMKTKAKAKANENENEDENEEKEKMSYILITGDKRLSPDNGKEINAATDDENKNGDKVKVILVSREGAEGVDLKFIRQVHILEPSRSMSLIEQVIGRAVRNFSHKALPFEKRNVQLYLYGSLLPRLNEELVDLYLYRQAGIKAIQMGKVSRLLKKTAVDCIMNHDQTNFTQEVLQEKIDGFVKQELSTYQVIDKFPIGDEPFSAICDYMSTCYYDCEPFKKIEESDINNDTFNSKFLFQNTERIKEQIKYLFKEEYFYPKSNFIQAIRTTHNYALIEIYAALNQMIKHKNEAILDKYGRPGRVVNIGDYYLFQPEELFNSTSDAFAVSHPVDMKKKVFLLNDDITKEVKEENKENAVKDLKLEGQDELGFQIMREIKENYSDVIYYMENDLESEGQMDSWYKITGTVIRRYFTNISKKLLDLVVAHNIESLLPDEKMALMNYIYAKAEITDNLEEKVKTYFMAESLLLETTDEEVFILDSGTDRVLFLDQDERKWREDNIESNEEFATLMRLVDRDMKKDLASLVGFLFNSTFYLWESKKHKEMKCGSDGKKENIKILEHLYKKKDFSKMSSKQVCVAMELILRYRNGEEKKKVWFLSPSFLSKVIPLHKFQTSREEESE